MPPPFGSSITTDMNVAHVSASSMSAVSSRDWTVDFGDGTSMTVTAPFLNVAHSYAKSGKYTVGVMSAGYATTRNIVITIPRPRAVRH